MKTESASNLDSFASEQPWGERHTMYTSREPEPAYTRAIATAVQSSRAPSVFDPAQVHPVLGYRIRTNAHEAMG